MHARPIQIEDDDEPSVADGKIDKVDKGKECLEFSEELKNPCVGFDLLSLAFSLHTCFVFLMFKSFRFFMILPPLLLHLKGVVQNVSNWIMLYSLSYVIVWGLVSILAAPSSDSFDYPFRYSLN